MSVWLHVARQVLRDLLEAFSDREACQALAGLAHAWPQGGASLAEEWPPGGEYHRESLKCRPFHARKSFKSL